MLAISSTYLLLWSVCLVLMSHCHQWAFLMLHKMKADVRRWVHRVITYSLGKTLRHISQPLLTFMLDGHVSIFWTSKGNTEYQYNAVSYLPCTALFLFMLYTLLMEPR
jgi:hypothetical protein